MSTKSVTILLNKVERAIIQKRLDDSFLFIKEQNRMNKDLRDQRAIDKAKIVRDTMSRWLKESGVKLEKEYEKRNVIIYN